MSQSTVKTIKKFSDLTFTPYKRTLKEVRSMSADERGLRLKAMREFIDNAPPITVPWLSEDTEKSDKLVMAKNLSEVVQEPIQLQQSTKSA